MNIVKIPDKCRFCLRKLPDWELPKAVYDAIKSNPRGPEPRSKNYCNPCGKRYGLMELANGT